MVLGGGVAQLGIPIPGLKGRPPEYVGHLYGFVPQQSRIDLPAGAPYIGARLWERFSPKVPFVITAFAALLTVIPTWLFFKVPDDPSPPTELAHQYTAGTKGFSR